MTLSDMDKFSDHISNLQMFLPYSLNEEEVDRNNTLCLVLKLVITWCV